ncbi:Crp/Fnr family transcriptional regulator [Ferruginibacter sp.]|nr:hypothetical protein [Ferruginibacter sp.]
MKKIQIRYYQPRRFLRKQYDKSDKIFFIRKGIVHLYRKKEKTDWLSCENNVICPFNRFIMEEVSSVTYETLEPTEVQIINYNDCIELFEFEDFKNAVYRVIIDHLYKVSKFHADNVGYASKRYEVFIHHFPNIVNRVPIKVISTFLGVCPKTISRIKLSKK